MGPEVRDPLDRMVRLRCTPLLFSPPLVSVCLPLYIPLSFCTIFPHSFGAMPNQQDNQQEPQQHNGRVALSPQVLAVLEALVRVTYHVAMDYLTPLYLCTPYHTSALSSADWIHELLTGHPERIRNELGVYRGTFMLLVKELQEPEISLWPSHHVSVEEQVAIFLYTMVTGLSCTHVGECFQQSSSTITK